MYHTTNQIEGKIELQIALIAVNFFDFFSDVIVTFKGQLPNVSHNVREILASNHV